MTEKRKYIRVLWSINETEWPSVSAERHVIWHYEEKELLRITIMVLKCDMVWIVSPPNLKSNYRPQCWSWGLVGGDWIIGVTSLEWFITIPVVLFLWQWLSSYGDWLFKSVPHLPAHSLLLLLLPCEAGHICFPFHHDLKVSWGLPSSAELWVN